MSSTQKVFLRYLSGQTLHINSAFANEELNRIMLLQHISKDLDISSEDFCSEEKSKTLSVEIYYKGIYQGLMGTESVIKEGSIAKLNMSGVMMVQDQMCSYGMNSYDIRMRELYQDSRIAGIINYVDSGGGQSHAGDLMRNTISDRNKPVLTYTNFMCSAAYNGSSPSDEIMVASEATIVGSIGTMMNIPKWYIESSNEEDIELYSKKSPNKNRAWRELKKGNNLAYIDSLTENDEAFMASVQKFRNLKGSQSIIENTLSGAIFTGIEAKKRGLVDSIGTFNYALKRINSHIKNY